MLTYRTNKYLIKPTQTQKEMIKKITQCSTIVYNKFIEENGFEKYKYRKSKDWRFTNLNSGMHMNI